MSQFSDRPANKSAQQNTSALSTQEQFCTIVTAAPVMLWMANSEGESIFFNDKWLQFIGSDDNSSLEDTWYKSLHPDDKQECLDAFRKASKLHRRFEMEYRLRRADGEYRNVLDTGEPYYSDSGDFMGYIGSTMDITDRKCSEEALKKSHQEMQRHRQEMMLIDEINTHLQICQSTDETPPVIKHFIQKLFPNESGALYMLNSSKSMVESVVVWGDFDHYEQVFGYEDCWGLRKGKTHVVNKADDGLICKHLSQPVEHGYTCAPLIAHSEMVGVLHVQFAEINTNVTLVENEQEIKSRQRRTLTCADNLALALASLKLREALRQQSVRDPLTQLFNRRYMQETLERELSRSLRNDMELGIIMMDIDHF